MTVLVNLNHGSNQSYLLLMKDGFKTRQVRQLLKQGEDHAIQALFAGSRVRTFIPPADLHAAEHLADFTISQRGYTIERLA